MNSLKRFFREEKATAESASTVIMIAAVGVLLVAGLIVWWTSYNAAMSTAGNKITSVTNQALSNIQ